MKVINQNLLASFRIIGCEWCKKPKPTEAAHLWAKGHGGGLRLDVRVNLIALCRECHQGSHDRPCHADLLAMVATRENVRQDQIEEVIYFFRRLSKRPTMAEVLEEMMDVQPGARALARRTLDEIPVEQQYWRIVA